MPSQKVRCGPHFHHIEWSPTGPTFADHGSPSESVIHALGGPSGCGSRVEAWKRTGIELGEVHTWVADGITDPFRAGTLARLRVQFTAGSGLGAGRVPIDHRCLRPLEGRRPSPDRRVPQGPGSGSRQDRRLYR